MIIDEREATHGSFQESARTSQGLKNILRISPCWHKLSYAQQEALDQIMTKAARILAGNPNHPDHWLDIEGYAQQGLNNGKPRPTVNTDYSKGTIK